MILRPPPWLVLPVVSFITKVLLAGAICPKQRVGSSRSSRAPPGVVAPLDLPLAHQLLKLIVAAFGQRDAYCHEQIASSVLGRESLAPEPERASGTGAARDRELDRPGKRRHPHLAAEHRLVERDRQVEPQVSALALEQRMRSNRHRDQDVTRAPAWTGEPLATQPDLLAVGEPGRDFHLDLLAAWQLHPALGAARRLR